MPQATHTPTTITGGAHYPAGVNLAAPGGPYEPDAPALTYHAARTVGVLASEREALASMISRLRAAGADDSANTLHDALADLDGEAEWFTANDREPADRHGEDA